jgi:hypothetical protein
MGRITIRTKARSVAAQTPPPLPPLDADDDVDNMMEEDEAEAAEVGGVLETRRR